MPITAPASNAHPAWVVAADHGRARLFRAAVASAPLQEVEDLVNPAALQREHELVSDRPGRVVKGRGGRARAVGHHESHRERAAEQFAGSLCRRLAQARSSGEMGRLYLIAGPEFLGLVRRHLDAPTRALVAAEIGKDVTTRSAAELRALLPAQL